MNLSSCIRAFGLAALFVVSAASVGCAGETIGAEEKGATTSHVRAVGGKCPEDAVCLYENADYNDYDPPSAWSLEFSAEEVYATGFKVSIDENRVSSMINNSKKTICLIDLQPLQFDEQIYRLGPGERTAFVGHGVNDRGDRIEECE